MILFGLEILIGLIVFLGLVLGIVHWLKSGRHPIPEKPDGAIRLGTYNVHYIKLQETTGDWSVEDWERRKEPLNEAFNAIGPDIMTFQEMESFGAENGPEINLARDYLAQQNPTYALAAVGDWTKFPSTQPIFYRRDRFELLDQGWFAFPETYKRMRYTCEVGGYPYFASWAHLLEPATGKTLRVVNMHLDYCNLKNRRKSASLIRDHIRPWLEEGENVVLMGDFNACDGMKPLRILKHENVHIPKIAGASFHFNRGLHLFSSIDHMVFSKGVRMVTAPLVVREKFLGEYPSDHYPLLADVHLS